MTMSKAKTQSGSSQSTVEDAALRKFMHQTAKLSDVDLGEEPHILEVSKAAIQAVADMKDCIDELESTVEEQQDTIDDLRRGTTADNYEAMTAKEREQKVAQALRTKAENNKFDGAALDYAEIVALFENEIPNGSAYKLMKRLDNREGYTFEQRSNGNNRVKHGVKE